MIQKDQLRTLVPHAGEMCLLDSIDEWTADEIRCTACTHLAPHNPLRRQRELSALHLVEYAAQAMAAHGALLAQGSEQGQAQPGMLGALRDIRFHCERLDLLTGPLVVVATRRLARADGLVYDFKIDTDERALCEGRVIVALGMTLADNK
jgi:predicted hotdog family 3-hydroxylacyl-ACP dehydratase